MAKLATAQIGTLAKAVDEAARSAKAIGQLSKRRGVKLSLEDAYRVQAASIARRGRRRERRSGVKMGFTSRAKAAQMGVSDLIYGRLTEAMLIADGGILSLKDYIHPRVEPEVATSLSCISTIRTGIGGRVCQNPPALNRSPRSS